MERKNGRILFNLGDQDVVGGLESVAADEVAPLYREIAGRLAALPEKLEASGGGIIALETIHMSSALYQHFLGQLGMLAPVELARDLADEVFEDMAG